MGNVKPTVLCGETSVSEILRGMRSRAEREMSPAS
jgi:hypothetical protein